MRYLIIIPTALLCTVVFFAIFSILLNKESTGLTNEEIELIRESKPKPSSVEYVEPYWVKDSYKEKYAPEMSHQFHLRMNHPFPERVKVSTAKKLLWKLTYRRRKL